MPLTHLFGLLPLLGRVLLAGVFTLAGVAKLAGRTRAAQSFTEFGIPEQVAGVAVSSLAVAELVCALAILPTETAWFGAVGIAILLTVFMAAIGVTLARGRKPECQCFGQLRSEPIGPRILVRNSALCLAAAFVAWDAAPGVGSNHVPATWVDAGHALASSSAASVVATASLVGLVAMAFALVAVLRQYGKLLLRVERIERELGLKPEDAPAGLPVGSPAPAFDAVTLDAAPVSLADLQAVVKSAVLVFVEPGCGPCGELLPHVADAQQRAVPVVAAAAGPTPRASRASRGASAPLPGTAVVLVSQGSARENREKIAGLEVPDVVLQRGREVADAYGVVGTPSAVRVTNGMIASPLAVGPAAVRALLDAALESAQARALGPGDDVPSLSLSDLDGRSLDLRSAARGRTLLLFWNPACGYCQQMLATLREWERRADPVDVTLLVVSQGSAESNREQRFRSRVLLDDTFHVGQAFGASGTPSAVLVEHGRVASDVATGASAVFALATPRRALAGHV